MTIGHLQMAAGHLSKLSFALNGKNSKECLGGCEIRMVFEVQMAARNQPDYRTPEIVSNSEVTPFGNSSRNIMWGKLSLTNSL